LGLDPMANKLRIRGQKAPFYLMSKQNCKLCNI